jgi:hypothetical protein
MKLLLELIPVQTYNYNIFCSYDIIVGVHNQLPITIEIAAVVDGTIVRVHNKLSTTIENI